MFKALKTLTLVVGFSNLELFAAGESPSGLSRPAAMPLTTPNRSVFANGVDISSARNLDLRNVHINISETGDIYISAPQYQVTEEETFMPLSPYKNSPATPEHKPPQPLNSSGNPTTMNNPNPKSASLIDSPVTIDKTPATPLNEPSKPASGNPPK